jgi:hypothetical protein
MRAKAPSEPYPTLGAVQVSCDRSRGEALELPKVLTYVFVLLIGWSLGEWLWEICIPLDFLTL